MERYTLAGLPASPFSIKVRALMRYRRLAFDWVLRDEGVRQAIESSGARPVTVPALKLPINGTGDETTWVVDSTPIAELLEERHPEDRSVLPADPALRFLMFVLEDMADELAPKTVLRFRYHEGEDVTWVSRWVVGPVAGLTAPDLEARAAGLVERQIGMSAWSGVSAGTAGLIEQFYLDCLKAFEALLDHRDYLFGSRPSLADFAWYGQLMQGFTQSISRQIMIRHAPKLTAWLAIMEDASGVEGDWAGAQEPLPAPVLDLLRLAGTFYLPSLLANEEAVLADRKESAVEVPGGTFRRGAYPYQVKCLNGLRDRYRRLDAGVRERLAPILAKTGCDTAFGAHIL